MNKLILIVEDDLDDREILEESIFKIDPSLQLKFAENGADALRYLQVLREARQPLPQLITLDLNMPYLDGLQTYKQLLSDHELRKIPVAVFTSSQHPGDKELFERMGGLFLTKPYSFDNMGGIVQQLLTMTESQPIQ